MYKLISQSFAKLDQNQFYDFKNIFAKKLAKNRVFILEPLLFYTGIWLITFF
jgi:hypothetical protein